MEKEHSNIDIELRSNEVQEILTRPPHQLIRYGTGVICAVLALLIASSFFFNYPDIVSGEVIITTENPPLWVTAKATGHLKEIYCTDNQIVSKGEILGVVENPANTEQMLFLHGILDTLKIHENDFTQFPDTLFSIRMTGGSVQSSFNDLINAAISYRNFFIANLIQQDRQTIISTINSRKNYLDNLKKLLESKEQEYRISESNYLREKRLNQQKVTSDLEFEQAEQRYLNTKQELQQIRTNLAQEEVRSAELNASLEKLSVSYEREKIEATTSLSSSLRLLKSEIAQWKHDFVLVAPDSGTVTFNQIWKENQQIRSGDKVFAIVSSNPGRIIARMDAPIKGSGKITTGQTVNIRIDGYPHLEFGMIKGKTAKISLVPNEKNYQVEVEIPQNLITTNQKIIAFSGELTGIADIITENRTLIERIFSPIRYLLSYSK